MIGQLFLSANAEQKKVGRPLNKQPKNNATGRPTLK